MIKLLIPYKSNAKASLPEQAAGFPPFTRGYVTVQQDVKLACSKTADFTLKEYTDNSIIDLFTSIISRQAKGKWALNLPFTGKPDEIIYIRVLRTLLALVSEKTHQNPYALQFELHGNTQNYVNEILTINLAQAAQIDFLLVDNLNHWQQIKLLTSRVPVDSLYGTNYLEEETSAIFFTLWSKIETILM